MAEVPLECFYIISGTQGIYRISVAQVVNSSSRHTDLFHNALEAVIHRAIGKMIPDLIGKYEV